MKSALFALVMLAAFPAHAQETREPFSLSDVAALLGPSDRPEYRGASGFAAASGATAVVNAGHRRVGDTILEIATQPLRTARLGETVSVSDPRHGARTIAAETPLIALHDYEIGMQGDRVVSRQPGQMKWCVLSAAPSRMCIEHRRGPNARVTETTNGRRVQWGTPVPQVREEPLADMPAFTRRIVIREITEAGIVVEDVLMFGEERFESGGPSNPLPFGQGFSGGDRFAGARFVIRRGSGGTVT